MIFVRKEDRKVLEKLNEKKKIVIFIMLIFSAVVLYISSWNSDDAYHSYVMARHMAEGKGLVYNVGYRVNASTCPMFTILEAIVFFFLKDMYLTGIILGLAFSLIAFGIIFRDLAYDHITAVMILFMLLGSYCFVSYTSAGLENSLLYFLGILFLSILMKAKRLYDVRTLLSLTLVFSVILLTRMDNVLIYFPIMILVYLYKPLVSLGKRIIIALIGLSPFIIWELFSLVYFGFLFPNTFYMKLITGIDKSEYATKGLDYLYRSFSCDFILLFAILAFVFMVLFSKCTELKVILAGIIIYILYVISIGGDFMLGRHLTVPYVLSIYGIFYLFRRLVNKKTIQYEVFALVLVAGVYFVTTNIRDVFSKELYEKHYDAGITSVADEKSFYVSLIGDTRKYLDNKKSHNNDIEYTYYREIIDRVGDARQDGKKGIVLDMAYGAVAYYGSLLYDDICITDPYALGDPLLAHLPAEYTNPWRVGHMQREIPKGYYESVEKGCNEIEDIYLKEYYDKILLITASDELFSQERITTIINMNIGKYDYLIEEYISNNQSDKS